MSLHWKILLVILKASGMTFIAGTLGVLFLDFIFLIFSSGYGRLKYASALFENIFFFVAFYLIGASFGVLLVLIVHGRNSLEK